MILRSLLAASVFGLFGLAAQEPAPVGPPTPAPTPTPTPVPVPLPGPVQVPTSPPSTATPPTTPPRTAESIGEPNAGQENDGEADAKPKEPRRGIAVDDLVVQANCSRCHALDAQKLMTRISYVRKSPEGWSESIKRMGRLYGLQLSASDAKYIVRSLSNSHGLARSEAERGLYASERRVHWSEEQHEQDFKRACSQCHPLGVVLLQQRDDEEWQLLRATHVAMFPLARGQMGGGPPEDDSRRGGGGGQGGGQSAPIVMSPQGAGAESANRDRAARSGSGGERDRGQGQEGPGGGPDQSRNVGDRVLQKLAKDQPLFTPAWETWTRNRREVPLAGTWTVSGHEVGRGDVSGTVELRRTADDEYDVRWNVAFADGSRAERTGKGLLYAGYSWRGRCQDTAPGGAAWREVLLLDDEWRSLRGRLFTGDYDEIGADVTLHREVQRPRVVAVGKGAIVAPSIGHRLEIHGEALPEELRATDFFVGEGLTVTAVERDTDRHGTLVIDAAADAPLGARTVAYGSEPGIATIEVYDTVDYVRIRPLQGLARIGGGRHPKQLERFEAFAVHRGPDRKPYTDDDVDLFQVRPRWALEEFRVRENDDDLAWVGSIDAVTGVFTPAIDGPNPQRKWQANNVGDVFVTAAVELDVAVRPEPPKPAPAKPEPAKAGAEPTTTTAPPPPPTPTPVADDVKPADEPPRREQRTFQARAHLLVTVPLYTRWNALDWETR